MFSTRQSVRPEPGPGRTAVCRPVRSFSKVDRQVRIKDEDGTAFRRPVRSFLELAPHVRAKDRAPPSPTVPGRPMPSPAVPRRLPPSSAVFRCFPLFSAVPAVPYRPPPSSTAPSRPLPSPTRICLRSWGLSSFLMTAVLEIQGRGRTALRRPVSSRGLGSPPAGPYGGPGRLRTLPTTSFHIICICTSQLMASFHLPPMLALYSASSSCSGSSSHHT